MSRTYRNLEVMNRCALRNPKTSNERKNLIGIIQDNYIEEYEISGVNHLRSRLTNCPTANYDKVISAYYQESYRNQC
jgi:two-component SAPR family response regulator